MITATQVTKTFDSFKALNKLTCSISNGSIYGLVGSNGAGKSTFLRLLTGIYRPDSGKIMIDEESIYDQPLVKQKCVLVPDDVYFLPQSNMKKMADIYATSYEKFDYDTFYDYADDFNLNPKANINTFSKGMKRQAAIILALSCRADYLFFDETFDGLDPVMRQHVKNIIYNDIYDRNATAVITSHSLRELEDTCDQLSLLHQGRLVFESDIQHIKTSLFKIQVAFDQPYDKTTFKDIKTLHYKQVGKVANLIVEGSKEEVSQIINSKQPILYEVLPLSLEEVFVYELEALGYAFDSEKEGDE